MASYLRNLWLKTSVDEVGDIIDVANNLAKYQREIVNFSNDIRQGEFNTNFKSKNEYDALCNSLIQMRNSLKEESIEDFERNWRIKGLAQFVIFRPRDHINHVITSCNCVCLHFNTPMRGSGFSENIKNFKLIFRSKSGSFPSKLGTSPCRISLRDLTSNS
ncbi:MAG: hypothetical protein HRT71_16450 [Flavobacteriales bacterium]|nr:hypothetical protein [Flavobacteriales bacterium]